MLLFGLLLFLERVCPKPKLKDLFFGLPYTFFRGSPGDPNGRGLFLGSPSFKPSLAEESKRNTLNERQSRVEQKKLVVEVPGV